MDSDGKFLSYLHNQPWFKFKSRALFSRSIILAKLSKILNLRPLAYGGKVLLHESAVF